MINIHNEGMYAIPRLTCDWCKKPISSSGGNAMWIGGDGMTPMYVVCKPIQSSCDSEMEQWLVSLYPDGIVCTDEIEFMLNCMHNHFKLRHKPKPFG